MGVNLHPGNHEASPPDECNKCPFGNGNALRQGSQWIQRVEDRLNNLETAMNDWKEEYESIKVGLNDIKINIEMWRRVLNRVVVVLAGAPAFILVCVELYRVFRK